MNQQFIDFFKACDMKITSGCESSWGCFPEGCWEYQCSNEFGEAGMIAKGDDVYQIDIFPHFDGKGYRWVKPEFKKEYQEYTADQETPLTSFDDVLVKIKAILNGKPYEKTVVMELDLDDATILKLALGAHERDITMNQYIVYILENLIKSYKEEI